MRLLFLSAALGLAAVTLAPAADLEIKDAWVRAVPPMSEATAAFLIIVNNSGTPVALVGVESPVSDDIRPMITTRREENGKEVMGMEFVTKFSVAPHKSHALEPGGDHIMLMKLKSVPARGALVPLTLSFETAAGPRTINVEAAVR